MAELTEEERAQRFVDSEDESIIVVRDPDGRITWPPNMVEPPGPMGELDEPITSEE